jgi:hypothetical protein
MKKSILVFCLLLNSVFSFSQVLEKVGEFYDGNELMEKDSALVSELVNHYNIDTTGYNTIYMWTDINQYTSLIDNNYGVYYSLIVKDDQKSFDKVFDNTDKEKLDKYSVICEHNLYDIGKVINIIVF